MNQSKCIQLPFYARAAQVPRTSISSIQAFARKTKFQLHPKAWAVLTTCLVFIFDLLIPPHTAVGVLYLASMSLVFNQNKKTILLFASVSSFLILLETFIFFHEDLHHSVFSDRTISIAAIWMSYFVLMKYRRLNEKNMKQKEAHLKAIEEMAFLTSHKVRKPICTLQGLMGLINEELPQKDLSRIAGYMKESVSELDLFTRELNDHFTERENTIRKDALQEHEAQ